MFILLDIDGVMVPAASWRRPELLNDGFPKFSNTAISSLQRIISETGATIMLTTSHKSSYDLSQWKDIFSNRGINANIDKLPDNYLSLNRRQEIAIWLNTNSYSEFIIIDDDTSLNDLPAIYKDHLVLTSPMVGLNNDAASKALDISKKLLMTA
jgi:hypothetical protein